MVHKMVLAMEDGSRPVGIILGGETSVPVPRSKDKHSFLQSRVLYVPTKKQLSDDGNWDTQLAMSEVERIIESFEDPVVNDVIGIIACGTQPSDLPESMRESQKKLQAADARCFLICANPKRADDVYLWRLTENGMSVTPCQKSDEWYRPTDIILECRRPYCLYYLHHMEDILKLAPAHFQEQLDKVFEGLSRVLR